jgi:hypothetical protein
MQARCPVGGVPGDRGFSHGVRVALVARTEIIAVTTEFTLQTFRDTDLLDRGHIVDDPRTLPAVVRCLIDAARKRTE